MTARWPWLVIAVVASTARAAPLDPGNRDPGNRDPGNRDPGNRDPSNRDRNLRALTDDPILGKADRIDGDERKGVVAFTFDDGPNPETTPRVIDALEKYDIPATFFIVTQRIAGKHALRAPEYQQIDARRRPGVLDGSDQRRRQQDVTDAASHDHQHADRDFVETEGGALSGCCAHGMHSALHFFRSSRSFT